jgi:hypothetical protein
MDICRCARDGITVGREYHPTPTPPSILKKEENVNI